MTTKEKIAVMQAFDDGKEIEVSNDNRNWKSTADPTWDWHMFNYRVKPEKKKPTYRPYANFDEFRAEWEKHGGWVIGKRSGIRSLISVFVIAEVKELANCFTWADDGSPCGIKMED